MICPGCGAETGNSQFCTYCGRELRPKANKSTSQNYGDNYQQPRRQAQQQTYQPQPRYEDPSYTMGYHPDEHVSTWGWIGRQILLGIPIVGFILMLVWGFGGSRKRSLVTWARAQILITVFWILVAVAIVVIMMLNGVSWNEIWYRVRV